MAEIFDRLQFVKHEELFPTREDAVNYVLGLQTIDRPSLLAEPMILLYESGDATKGPNVILAIGSVGDGVTPNTANRTFFIDTQKTEEEIEELRELIEEAIKSLTIVPLDSSTLDLSAEKTAEGTFLSGDVKIADYRIVDSKVEENIIEVEGEKGIYAFVDMEYDPETYVITFKTNKVTKEFQLPPDQHVVKGWYDTSKESIVLKLADNSKVEIDVVKLIDEWTVLPDSTSPILLNKVHVSATTEGHDGVYDWQDILSGDVRVADHISDNIIHKDRTGRYLYVKGTADNIKYKEGVTVKDALDNVDCKVSTSTGNLIYKRPDGIYAYAMLDYNVAENKLRYTYSDGNAGESKTVEFQLNSVKILEDITYDPVKEEIVIRYIDAQGEYQKVEIPVHDIIEEWDVNNEGHSIKLNKYRSEGQGKDILTADAKIHDGHNNILEDLNHELYVNGIADNIKYDATGDTTVKDAIDGLSGATDDLNGKIDQEIADRTADVERIDNTIGSGFTEDPHDNITFKFEELTNNLNSEIERATNAENTIDEKLEAEITRSTDKDTEHDGRLDAIDAEIGEGFGPRNTVRDEIDNLQSEIDAVSAETATKLKDINNEDHSINIDKTDPTIPVIGVNLSEEVEDGKLNIIKKNADGLYAGVDLSYEETANKLIFKTTNGSKEIQLDSMSSIISIEYNPSKEAIVITYMTNGHEIKTVEIPVGDLINEWRVEDGHPHAVALEKVRVASGTSEQDVLKASVVITEDHDDNILVMDDGALYVPGGQIEQNKQDIEALKERMDSAEGDIDNLENGLANEIARATSEEQRIESKLDSEIERSTTKDTELENALNAEITRSTEKDQELTDAIAAEVTRATSAETALQTSINNESTRAIAEEARLQHLIDDTQSNLQDEITRATSEEQRIENKLDAEITRSTEKDQELTDAIAAEVTRATSAETTLQTSIDNEVTRATTEETRLQHLIEDEAESRINGDSQLNTKIETETSRARETEGRLETAINNEIARATTKENELNTAIVNETLRAQEADNELYHNLADETAERISADAALESKINQETSRAQVAENSISERLVTEINRSTLEDQAIRDLLAAETAARQEGDAELEQAIIDATLTFDDTTSIDFTKTTGNVVTADVKLQGGDNIIKLGQGLYATATLEYEPTGNKIRLVTSNGAQEYIQLVGATLLDSIEYDPVNKLLVIKYTDGTGSQRETSVGVTDLWNDLIVQNPSEKSAVEMTKTIGDPGNPDTLSARVLITDDRDGDGKPDEGSPNIIEIRNNGLFVDGTAMEDAKEIAECVQNEIKVLEKSVIGHMIGEECGSGYTYEPWNTAYYINSATSFNNADYILDLEIHKTNEYVDEVSAKTDCVDSKTDKIYELLNGVGATMTECGEGTEYHPYPTACVISAATSFMEADQLLNDQICQILTMWVSGITCSNESTWIEDGMNRKLQVDTRLSHGKYADQTDDNLYIHNMTGDYIDPTTTEFTDTNVLRIVCLEEGPSGITPSIDTKQNGVYLSNIWDCGLYYGPSDTEAKEAAEAAGFNTNYSTDEDSSASNYNYMNNVRQTDIPTT